MHSLRLNSFLKFGYFLDYDSRYHYDLTRLDEERYVQLEEENLIEIGVCKTKDAIIGSFLPGSLNLVPLSGGLDSRAILAGLLECTDASNIYTYTFGSPGTLDFEIGNSIAKEFGTIHTRIPLSDHVFSLDELIETSYKIDHQTVLFSTAPLSVLKEHFAEHVHWSGAFAGPPSGNVLFEQPSETKGAAQKRFVNHKYTHVKSRALTSCADEDLHDLLETAWMDPNIITYDEQLHLEFAQLKWIAPHVLMRGFSYNTPFLDPEWLAFMFGVDNEYRTNQYLYKKILLRAFPQAFSYRTKSHYGAQLGASEISLAVRRIGSKIRNSVGRRKASYIHPSVNYIDFNAGIRERSDLRNIVHESVMDLKARKIVNWIDIGGIWRGHVDRGDDFSDALLVLASLEIHLKAIEAVRNETAGI